MLHTICEHVLLEIGSLKFQIILAKVIVTKAATRLIISLKPKDINVNVICEFDAM